MFLAMGVIGILSVSGVLNGERVLGEWWPVAIVGWPGADAISERRFTIDGAIVAAAGATFLADEQGWVVEV